jgi:arylsulfatase A-like enzyme
VSHGLTELADLLPTFCALAGVPAPEDVTGYSLVDVLRGTRERVRDTLHGQIDSSHMFHDGRYKYLYGVEDGSELLFDVSHDRDDTRNLADDAGSAAVLESMRDGFVAHLREEGHEHLAGGRLLSAGQARPPQNRLRARNTAAWWVAVRQPDGA